MNYSNLTDTFGVETEEHKELNISYTVLEVVVAIVAVVGNALVILVFRKERRLRRRTNYYIVSLAVADLLVGLFGIPFAILASVGLPTNLYACLFTVSILIVLCTISIFCLVAVSVDRYWAILHPMGYSRNVRTKTALVIIGICWFAGSVIGFLPLVGWHKEPKGKCYFLDVMDMKYLVFLYFGTIITPALVLAAFYAHIYRVVLKQLRQIVTISPSHGTSTSGRSAGGGSMLRMLGAAQKREVKATQNLSIIVLFFMICWIPLYTINCVIAFCEDCYINETVMMVCIILSHANSAGNPLLYAYHLKDFRAALKNFLCDLFMHRPSENTERAFGGSTHYYRTSLASNTGLNNFYNYRHSLRESNIPFNLSQTNKTYVDSPIYFKRPTKSMSLPSTPKLFSIVPNSVAVAAATVDNHHIWKISEDVSLTDGNSNNDSSGMQTNPSTPFNKINSNTSSSLKNYSYLNDINYEEDDDVFLDDTLPITDLNYDEHELQNNFSDTVKLSPRQHSKPEILRHRKSSLSSSSPQLNRNLFLVESEMNVDKCEYKNHRSSSAVERNATGSKNLNKHSRSGEYISPAKSVKLSPLKAVGEHFWSGRKYPRSVSLSDESSVSPQSKKKKKGATYVNDNHSFGC